MFWEVMKSFSLAKTLINKISTTAFLNTWKLNGLSKAMENEEVKKAKKKQSLLKFN